MQQVLALRDMAEDGADWVVPPGPCGWAGSGDCSVARPVVLCYGGGPISWRHPGVRILGSARGARRSIAPILSVYRGAVAGALAGGGQDWRARRPRLDGHL